MFWVGGQQRDARTQHTEEQNSAHAELVKNGFQNVWERNVFSTTTVVKHLGKLFRNMFSRPRRGDAFSNYERECTLTATYTNNYTAGLALPLC